MAAPKSAGPVAGTFSTPPPGAPHEVSAPLDAATVAAQLAKAHANEKSLQPLPAGPSPAPPMSTPASASRGSASPAATHKPPVVLPPPIRPAAPVAITAPDGTLLALQPHLAVPSARPADPTAPEPSTPGKIQPAASHTDSPSRGIPRPIADPHKQITGGWGLDGPAAYYALSGPELAELIRTLMDKLNARLDTDLRFSIACCYPQVRVRVLLSVAGASTDAAINDVAFDLDSAQLVKLEAVRSDDDVTPADALRDEAELPKPRKHVSTSGAGKFLVDIEV